MLSNLKNNLETYMWKDIAENWASLHGNLQQNSDSSESEFLHYEITAKFSSFPWLFPAGMQMAQQAILQQRNAELLPKKYWRHIYFSFLLKILYASITSNINNSKFWWGWSFCMYSDALCFISCKSCFLSCIIFRKCFSILSFLSLTCFMVVPSSFNKYT